MFEIVLESGIATVLVPDVLMSSASPNNDQWICERFSQGTRVALGHACAQKAVKTASAFFTFLLSPLLAIINLRQDGNIKSSSACSVHRPTAVTSERQLSRDTITSPSRAKFLTLQPTRESRRGWHDNVS